MQVEDRITALEERTRALEAHVGLAPAPRRRPIVTPPEKPTGILAGRPRETVSPPPPAPRVSPAPSVSPPRARVSRTPRVSPPRETAGPRPRQFSNELEDLIGGRLLAWIGGLAVALGVIFLLAIAVSRGWIGEVERTLLAGLLSGGLLAGGIRLHGRRGRTDAAKAATAAGIVGLFATAVVAGSVYQLVPALLAIAAAIAVGATATALALRWEAPGIAALGILGALASPGVLDGMTSSSSVVMLFVATASATAVVIWQRWTWLGFASYLIATPQWLMFLGRDSGDAVILAVLVAFGALTAAAAVGFEVRSRAKAIGVASILLLSLNALVLSVVGVARLDHADVFLVVLALAHIAVGVASRRTTRISPDLAMAGLALGVVLADVAAARILDGLPLVVSWAAGGALFAGLMRAAVPGLDRHAALVGLGAHMALALTSAVLVAPAGSLTGQIGLITVAATALISGRLAEEGRTTLRMVLDAISLALVAYVTVTGLDDLQLTLALAAQTFGLIGLARRHRKDPIAVGGAIAFAALTVGHAVAVLAPPDAIVAGLAHPLPALAGLGAATFMVALLGLIDPKWQPVTRGTAALLVLYTMWVELDGVALALALAAGTAGMILLARRYRDDAIARVGALLFAVLTTLHAVIALAPPEALNYGLADPLAAAAGLGAAAVVVALLGLVDETSWPVTRGAAALLVLYATAVELEWLALTVGFAVVTVGQILIARRYRDDPIAVGGAIAFAALTALDAVTVLAPPEALIYGLADPLPAAVGLAATTAVAALLGLLDRRWAAPAAVLALYGVSVELVTAFADTPQLAQTLLSALWAATGVGLLIAGLVRDTVVLRQAALALLAVTVAKVFLYDLASLDSLSRVASFIALGLLLLAGAFAWQRFRPRPLQDLRRMPGSLR